MNSCIEQIANNLRVHLILVKNDKFAHKSQTETLSDHLLQFSIASDIKYTIYSINFFKDISPCLIKKNFVLGCLFIDWKSLIKTDNGNVDNSFMNFLINIFLYSIINQENNKILRVKL